MPGCSKTYVGETKQSLNWAADFCNLYLPQRYRTQGQTNRQLSFWIARTSTLNEGSEKPFGREWKTHQVAGGVVVIHFALLQWVRGSIPLTGCMCKWFPIPCSLSQVFSGIYGFLLPSKLVRCIMLCWCLDPFGNKSHDFKGLRSGILHLCSLYTHIHFTTWNHLA